MSIEGKTYPKEKNYLKKIIETMAEIQKWDVYPAESGEYGIICRKNMYGITHEYKITVSSEPAASSVRIETDETDGTDEIRRQFSLLEKLMAFDEGRAK